MRFKTDENLPPDATELLRQAGHEVLMVFDQGLRSPSDPEVIAVCQKEGLVLLSPDLDFSNILVFPPEQFAGIMEQVHQARRGAKP